MSVSAASSIGSSKPVTSSSDATLRENQSKQGEANSAGNAVDPRPTKTLSPRSSDAILTISNTKDPNSLEKANSKPGSDNEIIYHTARRSDTYNEDELILPEQSVTTPGNSPGSGDGPGSTAGTTAPGGEGESPSTSDSGGSTSVVDDSDHEHITYEAASETTYQSLFSENPRNAKVGDENQGAVAVDKNSGQSSDGTIWSEGKIIFKTSKGVFWASSSTPGGVIFARIVNGSLDISSGHKA